MKSFGCSFWSAARRQWRWQTCSRSCRWAAPRWYGSPASKKGNVWTSGSNADNLSAVVSWVLMSHALWIGVSTTTFASGVLYLLNTVQGQDWVAAKVGNLITRNTGVKVIFEHAQLANYGSTIQFHKVFVSRRPDSRQVPAKTLPSTQSTKRESAQRAQLAVKDQLLVAKDTFQQGNYTQFDLSIEQVDVTLSFWKWFNGQGIIETLHLNGVRGIIDRTHLRPPAVYIDPTTQRHVATTGDFHIDKFTLSDMLITMYQPNGFRPFNVSVINCILTPLRKHWLLFDVLNGQSASGSFDNSMFVLQKLALDQSNKFRIDQLDIDHLNAGVQGPFGWIDRGHVNMEVNYNLQQDLAQRSRFDVNLQLMDVKARVPFFQNPLTYKNHALIRPIIGYINAHRTYIPIVCQINKQNRDFEGAWTFYDSALLQDLSQVVFTRFEQYVQDDQLKADRLKRVTFWSLQLFLQTVLMALSGLE